MVCDPNVCPNCQYIGEGDSICDVTQEIVLEDWMPTDKYMGSGCPYLRRRRKKKGGKQNGKERVS